MKLRRISGKKILFLALLSVGCFVEHTRNYAHAQYFLPSSSRATGGTGRASVSAADGLFLNPSAVALANSFEMDIYYRDGSLDQGAQETMWGITMMDNSTDVVVPGAITYMQNRRHFSGIGYVDEKYWRGTVGKFWSKGLAFGFSVDYLNQRDQDKQKFTQWDSSMGASLHATKSFSAAITYNQFLDADSEIPEHLRLQPSFGFGLRYKYQSIIEVLVDSEKQILGRGRERWSSGAGLRTFLGDFFGFSLGTRQNGPSKTELYSLGLSFLGPKMQIHYAFEMDADESKYGMHSVDLRMPF